MTDLPSGWVRVPIADVADVRGGIQKQAKRRPVENKYPFLRVANVGRGFLNLEEIHEIELFGEELERYALRSGDLLVVEGNGSPGEIGRAAMWHGEVSECVHQNHLICVRPTMAILPRFLELAWNSPSMVAQLRTVASTTSGLYTLSTSKIKRVEIAVPPLGEQRRIVAALEEHLAHLDAADAGMDRVERRLKSLAKRILLEAVPIPVPDHWKLVPVADAGRVELGRQRHPDWHTGPHMRPYLRVANVFEDRIDTSDLMEMDFPPDAFERYRLVENDILLNEGQSPEYLGRPAMYRGIPANVAFTNSLLRFRAGPDVLPEWALLVFRRHLHARRFIREVRITTNIAHLSATRLKSVEFPIPPLEEQECIVAEVREKLASIERFAGAVVASTKRAQGLRKALLAQAFVGRLVEQDPADEPVSVLLEQIRGERAARRPVRRTRRGKGEKAPQKETML